MDFDLSPEQVAIQRSVRDFLGARSDMRAVRRQAEARTYDSALWPAIVAQGWSGIAVAEGDGGAGLGHVELALVAEEFGYACAPSPFFSNSAALLMLAAAEAEQRARWLPGLLGGSSTGAVGTVLRNGSALVPDAGAADVLVLVEGAEAGGTEAAAGASAASDSAGGGVTSGVRAWLVPRAQVHVEPIAAIDITRPYFSVRFEPGAGESLELRGDVAGALDTVELLLSAELTGVAARAMEMAVQYAKDRTQFGRPIGAYQAVSHRCADMLLAVESSRSATYYAAWTADAEPHSLRQAASVAKATAAETGWRVTSSSLQVHGGIGFTWEHDLQFLLKRAAADARLFGSVSLHRDRVAQGFGLAPPAG
ncbi:MAG: acyl-CoA dehydrogenase family protein [Candidatus Dormibacteria bacterium]